MAEGSNVLNVVILGAILLIGAGVTVSLGAQVTNTININSLTNGVTVTNQTIAFSNNTVIALSGSQVTSITSVSNLTQTYSSGNYTLTSGQDSSSINVSISCGGPGAAASGNCTGIGNLNVTYVVNQKNTASLTAANSTSGLAQLATQFPNVGLVIGASAILAIIFGVLMGSVGRGRRE